MTQMNSHEAAYRRTGRILVVWFVLYVPVMFVVGFGLAKLLNSRIPFYGTAAIYFALMIFVSVQRFVADYRLTGKCPFDWLFRELRPAVFLRKIDF